MARQTTRSKGKSVSATGKAQKSTQKQKRHELVRAKILEIDGALDKTFLNLSQLLSESYHKEYPELWGYEEGPAGFREFCDDELNVGYRKSMYMVDIWDKVVEYKLDKRKVAALGWTKMKDIATVITEKNAKEWLEKAKEMSTREVSEAVKISRKPDGGDGVPSIVTMKFQMGDSEANIVTDALSEAKKLLNTTNDTNALEYICQEWMGDSGVTPERSSLADHINFVEKTFGVKVTTKVDKKRQAQLRKEAAAAAEEAEEAKEEGVEEEGEEVELEDMSKPELVAFMKENDLTVRGFSKMTKKALREAIEAALEDEAGEENEEGGEEGDGDDIDDLLGI